MKDWSHNLLFFSGLLLSFPGWTGEGVLVSATGASAVPGSVALTPVAADKLAGQAVSARSDYASRLLPISTDISIVTGYKSYRVYVASSNDKTLIPLPTLSGRQPASADPSLRGRLSKAVRNRARQHARTLRTSEGVARASQSGSTGATNNLLETYGEEALQAAVDEGVQSLEDKLSEPQWMHSLSLSYRPAYGSRDSLLQADALLSLLDAERSLLFTQAGIQSQDGEGGAHIGVGLRADLGVLLGVNVFYDYLSDPEVGRYSIGGEVRGRWLDLTTNWYQGINDEVDGNLEYESADGWDMEVSGHVPGAKVFTFSGRYYDFDVEEAAGDTDGSGQEYKLKYQPWPLLGFTGFYDVPEGDAEDDVGIETQVEWRFGVPLSEQLNDVYVRTPTEGWHRRYERVRREYDQRVTRKEAGPTVTTMDVSDNSIRLAWNNPAGATQVRISWRPTAGGAAAGASAQIPTVLQDVGSQIVSISGLTGTYPVTGLTAGIRYAFTLDFQNDRGAMIRSESIEEATSGTPSSVALLFVQASSTEIQEGADVNLTLALTAPPPALSIPFTLTGDTDYSLTSSGSPVTSPLSWPAGLTTMTLRLMALDDADLDSGTLVFTLSPPSPGAGYTLASGDGTTVTITVADNDVAVTPTVSLSASSTTIAENGGTSTLTVTLSSAPATTVNIPITVGGTATSGNDYNLANTLVSFTPTGALTQTVTVTAVNDPTDEPDETIILSVNAAGIDGVDTGTPNSVTITIIDDDVTISDPTVSLSVSSATIAENGGTSTLTVTLSSAPTTTVNIPITVGGTATSGNDYSLASASVSFTPTGALTRPVTVTAINDATDEPNETIILSVNAASITGVTGTDSVTITITDDDDAPTSTPTVSLSVSSATIAENGGTSTLTVTLSSAPTTTVAIPITVGGTATSGNDYSLASASVSFTPTGALTRPVTVTAINDATDEPNETIILSVNAASITGVTGTDSVTITITDDDDAPTSTPMVSFASAATTVAEDGSAQTITVNMTPAPVSTVTVSVTVGGTAAVTNDYTLGASLSGTPPNVTLMVTTSGTATITLTLVDDSDVEGSETVTLTLANGAGYTVGTSSVHTVTITDNDVPTVTLAVSSETIAENGGTSTLTVTLSAAPASAITIPITVGGTATIGSSNDFTLSAMSVMFPTSGAGATTQTVTITGVDDSADDNDETIILSVDVSSIVGVDAGATTSVTVTITDDDNAPTDPTVTLSVSPATISEADVSTTATLTVTLSAALATATTIPITVEGTATGTDDYTLSASSVMFPTSGAGATVQTLTITAVDDIIDDNDETIILSVDASSITGVAAGGTTSVTVTITDDDTPAVSFASGSTTVAEDGSAQTITVNVTPAPSGSLMVPVTVGGGAMPDDYTLGASLSGTSPNLTLTVTTSGTATITLTPVDDSDVESSETVTLTLGSGTGYTVGTPSVHTVTITDNDVAVTPEVSFASATTTVAEDGSAQTITVNATPAPASNIMVSVTVGGGAMTDDYTLGSSLSGTSPNLTLMVTTSGTATITLTPTDDSNVESSETVTLTLASGTGYTVGSPSVHTVTITDNDTAVTPVASFASATTTVAEDGSAQTITVNVAPAPASNIMVSVTVGGGAMTDDYTLGSSLSGTSPNLTLMVTTSGTATITLTPTDDSTVESSETVTLTLASGTGYTVGSPSVHTVTITDNDTSSTPVVSFTSATTTVAEDGSARLIMVRATPAPASNIMVSVTVGGDAAMTDDYVLSGLTGTPPNVTLIVPTSGTATMTLTPVEDRAVESSETVTLTVASGTGYTVGTTPVHTVTITNVVVIPVVSFASETTTVAEDGSAQTITVNMTPAPASTVMVSVTVGGTAAVTNDYTLGASLSGTPPNVTLMVTTSGTATITLTPVDDSDVEGSETVTLTLANGTGYTVGTTPVHTVTITDNDMPTVSLSVTPATLSEATIATTATLTVTLSATLSMPVIIPITVRGAAVGLGTDFSLSPRNSVTIPANSMTATMTITVVNDSLDEDDETFTLSLGTLPTAVTAGTTTSVTVTITDDDDAAVGTLPGAPASLTAAAASATQINLSWPAPTDTGSGIDGYRIQASTTGTAGTFVMVGQEGGRTFSHMGLTASTTYYYRVFAFNLTVGNGTAVTANATTSAATIPGAPTGLTARGLSATAITLNWTAPVETGGSAVTHYRIQVSTDNTTFTDLVADTGNADTTYEHSSLSAGTTRHYRVYASNVAGESSTASNVAMATTIAAGAPAAPTGLRTITREGEVRLIWTAPSGTVTGYLVEVSTNDGPFTVLEASQSPTFYLHSGLTGGTYTYRVSAINAAGTGLAATVSATVASLDPEVTVETTSPSGIPNAHSISEANATATATITLRLVGDGPITLTSDLTITLVEATATNPATLGVDYTLSGSDINMDNEVTFTTAEFASAPSNIVTKTVTVTVLDDMIDDDNENIVLNVDVSSISGVRGGGVVRIRIIDDDAADGS